MDDIQNAAPMLLSSKVFTAVSRGELIEVGVNFATVGARGKGARPAVGLYRKTSDASAELLGVMLADEAEEFALELLAKARTIRYRMGG